MIFAKVLKRTVSILVAVIGISFEMPSLIYAAYSSGKSEIVYTMFPLREPTVTRTDLSMPLLGRRMARIIGCWAEVVYGVRGEGGVEEIRRSIQVNGTSIGILSFREYSDARIEQR